MNREDVLRELELLPVWQLRAPLQYTLEQHYVDKSLALAIEKVPAIVEAVIEVARYEVTVSDDKKWAFVLASSHAPIGLQASTVMHDSSSILFNNILHSLNIDKTHKIQVINFENNSFENTGLENTSLENIGAKVIIIMGEATAQQLLNSTESIEQLRGKAHTHLNIPVIVTYHPQELLQHLPNKAKTWDDLCMAMQWTDA